MNIGSYQLMAQLGAGADGVSYRALDSKHGASVEMRVLNGAQADADRWKRLGKRLRLAALFDHPSALCVHELALQHEPPYVAMEWVEAKSLAGALAGALPLAVPEAVCLVRHLAAALAGAHRLGLSHGRLSPGNVRSTLATSLSPTEQEGYHLRCPKIDFTGIEADAPLDGAPSAQLDASFRAREDNGNLLAFEADVFCLGALLLWLLTGNPPSAGPNIPEAIRGLGDLQPGLAEPLERVLKETLAWNPVERPSAKEVEDRLSAMLSILSSPTVWATRSKEVAPNSSSFSSALESAPTRFGHRPIPDRLGRFHVREKLGQGGMGAVYRAEDTVDGTIVAIKVLRPELVERKESLRRFYKEARLLAEVNHPNVTNLLEANEDDGIYYLVLEFIAGQSIGQELARCGQLDERSALLIMAQVARALEDAHARGIVHRDIKPDNILLVGVEAVRSSMVSGKKETDKSSAPRHSLQIKLSDFGLARHVVESESLNLTQTGALVGTPDYMAPEQWTGGALDPRTDVYAMGATLFHLLAGRPPFLADNTHAVMAMHCNDPLPSLQKFNPDISDGVCQIVSKCLAKDPEARFADAGALLRDLERLLRGQPTSIIVHPKLPPCDPRTVFKFDWVWDLESSPAQLWPYASNTERLNRAVGLPAVQFTAHAASGGVRRFGRFRKAGFTNVWQEHPFEWIEGRRMGVLREYSQGVFKWLVTVTELEPRAGGGTRLTHQVRIEPKGLLGRLVATMEVGIKGRKAVERVYHRIDAALTGKLAGGALVDSFEGPAKLSTTRQQRLERLLDKLIDCHVAPSVAEKLGDYLALAPSPELARIRPLALARRLALDPEELVAAFLHGARQGLFVLLWDLLCPVCRIPSEVKDTLRALRKHGHCEACNLDFELDFANSVEMIFRIHPELRDTDLGTYCIGGPVHFPHVAAQARVGPGERIELDLALSEGAYRLRGPQLPFVLDFQVRPLAPARRWEVSLSRGLPSEYPPALRTGSQVIVLTNDHDQELLVRVERHAARQDALTAARASSSALFRELFPAEVLSPGQLISVATVTLLVTRLEGSRALYRDQGDARAFAMIHELFRILDDRIKQEGGAVVKTMGEGVLAVFSHTLAAVQVGLDLPAVLAKNEATRGSRLQTAIHRGPAMAATFNDHLDYFGTTVNVALDLLALLRGSDLALTHPVAADPQVASLLTSTAITGEIVTLDLPGLPLGLAHRLRISGPFPS